MAYSKFILFVAAFYLFSGLNAQKTGGINVRTESDGSMVKVRWNVDNPEHWKEGLIVGYRIVRSTISQDGRKLSQQEQFDSQIIMFNSFLPAHESTWPADSLNQAAHSIVYSTYSTPVTDDFSEIIEYKNEIENAAFFTFTIADQDFDIAVRSGLGMIDANAMAGKEYLYFIELNGAGDRPFGASLGSLDYIPPQLFAAEQISGEDGDKEIKIGWSLDYVENQYSVFDIYRSPAGANQFTRANDVPYLYIAQQGDDSNYGHYMDHPPAHGIYEYYVVGLTPFGRVGPPSEIVTVESRPRPMAIDIQIDSIATTETELVIHWPSLPSSTGNNIAIQRILKSDKVDGPLNLVSEVPSSARFFSDPNPGPVGYYVLEVRDEFGHTYRSPPHFGQLEDRTPPSTPTSFAGTDRGNGVINLSWAENTEPDLDGYRLFRATTRNSAFTEIGDFTILMETFADNLEELAFSDTIYYQLQAEDWRANASPKTEILAVPRADIFPPSQPVLLSANPTPAGIAFTWRYSRSTDIASHQLRRRAHGTRNWVTVVSITPQQEVTYQLPGHDVSRQTTYLDKALLNPQKYDYRLLAVDYSGNKSSSKVLTTRPLNTGKRGEITGLRAAMTCQDSFFVNDASVHLQEQIQKILNLYHSGSLLDSTVRRNALHALQMSGLITPDQFHEWANLTDESFYTRFDRLAERFNVRIEYRNCAVGLRWKYDVRSGLLHFKVLRSRGGSRLRPYKALPIEGFFTGAVQPGLRTFTYQDADATPGVRYVYKVVAVYSDGGYAETEGAVTVLVE